MRRADRAVTDRERILQVIESCECCRVGFSCPEGAYIVPLNFAFVPGTPDRFYFHGAQEGRKADLIRTAPRVGFELDCAHALTAGQTGCSYSYRYRSVIGTGVICEVQEPEEKSGRCRPSWRTMKKAARSHLRMSRRSAWPCSGWTSRS